MNGRGESIVLELTMPLIYVLSGTLPLLFWFSLSPTILILFITWINERQQIRSTYPQSYSLTSQGINQRQKRNNLKSLRMEAIKKKMQAMKVEKDDAIEKAEAKEACAREATLRGDKAAEEVQGLEKRKIILETELSNAQEALIKANADLDAKEKKLTQTESELNNLGRKVQLIEEDFEKTEERLKVATVKLAEALHTGDESERMRKVLKDRNSTDDERMKALEAQLKDANSLAEEADRKYDEVARKLAMVESDLDMAEDRAESGESKILELEEELKVVGNNLKSLEVAEEKARQREEDYKTQIKTLTAKLKQGEARAEFSQRTVQKLQKEVDRLEDELVNQSDLYNSITLELDTTYSEMTGY